MPCHARGRRGFSLVELLVTIGIITLLLGLIFPAIQRAREAMNGLSCRNNLKQMGLAMHMYHQDVGHFPPGFLYYPPPESRGASPISLAFRAGKKLDRPPPPPPNPPPNHPGWGWASFLLPYLEKDNLSRQINFDSPVESPRNQDIRTTMLRMYTCPTDYEVGKFSVLADFDSLGVAEAATNSYAACYGWKGLLATQPEGGNGVFYRNSAIRFADVEDGTTNTIAIGDRGAFFTRTPWAGVMTGGSARTTPGAPVYRSMVEPSPAMVMARIGSKPLNDPYSEPYDFFTPHRQVANFLFVDGAVHALNVSIDVGVLGALATRNGGENAFADD